VDNQEIANEALAFGWTLIMWFHNESTFYANDWCIVQWVHKGETAVPHTKGEGASLMVPDLDYGWLRSADGSKSTHVLFKAGKNQEGYFTNSDIVEHATAAMNILKQDYSDEDHVFVFDNTTTHQKQEEEALSATKMPKSSKEWGIVIDELNKDCNKVHGSDGKVLKMTVCMGNTKFANGTPQALYYPRGHLHKGLFKGMAKILVV
jgi:hypothetical protein